MTKELIIPADDPSAMKAFDPYSVQGMLNALTYFARQIGRDVKATPGLLGGKTYVMGMGDAQIILTPTDSALATKYIMVVSKTPPTGTTLGIFNPDKVEYDVDKQCIKFYARDPSAILTIHGGENAMEVDLKVTDIRHPDRVHGGTITYR
ncbi:MAG: hypothetical protein J7K40_06460 [candidate division Zixibacteria bacterium]|nr:hypothetical protein [candidate division Zixibacteria bacterium]